MSQLKKRGKVLPSVSAFFAFLSLFCYLLLTIVSKESGENTTLVLVLLGISFAIHFATIFTDILHLPSLISYAFDFIGLFAVMVGRVSYLAFFFSGDIMNTGLSVYLISVVLYSLVCVALDSVQMVKIK